MTAATFDNLAEVYDALIDWPKRLANEGPFFRRLFDEHGVQRVVDVACGTGRHAQLLHSWGLNVEGVDLNAGMIEQARAAFGESDRLRWRVQSFDQPFALPIPWDAALCLGNSLALSVDDATAERGIQHMLGAVRPGGVVMVQVLNVRKLPMGSCVWQKLIAKDLGSGEALILKGVHRCERKGYVDLVVLKPGNPPAMLHSQSIPFLGLERDPLDAAARAAGAAHVAFYGGYQFQPFDPAESTDLIMVAVKQ